MDKLKITANGPLNGEITVSGAKNAALLALRICASHDPALRERIAAYQDEMRRSVLDKATALKSEYPCDYGG